MNLELEIFNDWFRAKIIYVLKYLKHPIHLIIGNKKCYNVNSCIQNTALNRQYDTNFLGLILSSNLKWNKQVEVISNKVGHYFKDQTHIASAYNLLLIYT